eukprot:COSAG05_NODE_28104_length_133_cov_214519.294118_1_plen_32_part_10
MGALMHGITVLIRGRSLPHAINTHKAYIYARA